MHNEIYARLLAMVGKREPSALVTVVEASGSSPGKPGFKMLVDAGGSTWGTVGGGLLEATVTEDAVTAIRDNTCRIKTYTLTNDTARGLGMICGGEVTVFIDTVVPPETVVIAGAGHVAQPLAAMTSLIRLRTVVLDDREEFCNPQRFPDALCLVGDIAEKLTKLAPDSRCYVVIVTRGHALDQAALEVAIASDAAYIGMIGSRKKVEEVFVNLKKKGVSEEVLQTVHAPIGLDIAAQTAEEIAVSILAQIIAVKNRQ